ncbi:MAG: hypothetical protein GY827_08240 [Cytophagales bacterium]|nr:hypothetical protein [Cytophagales bacterium]
MKLFWKIIKALSLTIITVIITAVVSVHFFQDELIALFSQKVSKVLATDVNIGKVEISLISKFPNASIDLENVVIIESFPDSKDTLLQAQNIYLAFDIFSLVNQNYTIEKCFIENAKASVKVNKIGDENYQIFKEDTTSQSNNENTQLSFGLEEVVFKNINFNYNNAQTNQIYDVYFKEVGTSLSVKNEMVDVDVEGSLGLNKVWIDHSSYVRDKNLKLDIGLIYNTETSEMVIKPSKFWVEKSQFEASGTVSLQETTDINVRFKGHKTNIQSLLALLPYDIYQKLSDFKSKGLVYFNGQVKGKASAIHSPHIYVKFGFENASFMHKETKQEITNANLKGEYTNGKKNSVQTSSLSLKDINGKIKDIPFKGNFLMKNFDKPYLTADLSGVFDVKTLLGLGGLEGVQDAKGNLVAELDLKGYLDDLIDEKRVQKVNLSGAVKAEDVNVVWNKLTVPILDLNGELIVNRNHIAISDLSANVGSSDLKLQGYCHKFISYILSDNEILDIDGKLISNSMNLNELLNLVNEQADSVAIQDEQETYFNLPDDWALKLNCNVGSLEYEQFKGENIIKNLKGGVLLRNQVATLQNVSIDIARGSLGLNGNVDTRDENIFTIDGKLTVDNTEIDRFFFLMNDFDQDFFTHKNIKGEVHGVLDTHLEFSKALDFNSKAFVASIDMTVDNGKILDFQPMIEMGEFMEKKRLSRYLKNKDLSTIDFSQLKNHIQIQHDTIFIPRMEIETSANDFTITGKQTLSGDIDYDVIIPVVNYNKKEKNEQLGIFRDKKTKGFNVYLYLHGSLDDYEIEVRKKETLKSIFFNVEQGIQHVADSDNDSLRNADVGVDIGHDDDEAWIDDSE